MAAADGAETDALFAFVTNICNRSNPILRCYLRTGTKNGDDLIDDPKPARFFGIAP